MIRCARPTIAAAVWFSLLGLATPLSAQDTSSRSLREAAEAAATQLVGVTPQPTAPVASAVRERRPAPLVPLYLSFAALQALDVHSTSSAIDRGAVEANPLMKGLAGSEIGMIAVKAAGTTAVVYASERMWKKNRVAAVIFMVATNSAMAWVVNHNYRAAR
jgi:hypothetical protein